MTAGHIEWQAEIPVGDTIVLPPDPHLVDAIGRNHRLETAIADLVDNAIDAEANHVLIRFVVDDFEVKSLYVVDDGRGMTRQQLDAAMTMGSSRSYGATELGHFGLGLKAASFSQADSLTVVSMTADTAAVGRRWLRQVANQSFACDVVGYGFCGREVRRPWNFVRPEPGTVVRWDGIRTFPTGRGDHVSRFLQDATNRLQHHLGLIFHRFLADGRVRIGIDVEDIALLASGPVVEVRPLDPFAYPRTGAPGYPAILPLELGEDRPLELFCHIWPGRSQTAEFRLPGGDPASFQGFYIYRRDRLLQGGGWNNVEVAKPNLQLARISLDISDAQIAAGVFSMNPEKSRVDTSPAFVRALDAARFATGSTFREYLDTARATFKTASVRQRVRAQVMPVGRGLSAEVKRTLQQELVELPGRDPIEIRWRSFLGDDRFFEVDLQASTLWLNSAYRPALTHGRATINDAPVVKMLLYLLVERLFHGSYLGAKERDNVALWQELLTAAAKDELK